RANDQAQIGRIQGLLTKTPGVAVAFPTAVNPKTGWAAFQTILKGDPYSTEALDQISAMRRDLRAAVGADNVLVGGPTATQADTWAISNRDTIVVAVAALVVVAVILALLLRALVAPAYLLATNVLSYLAALGATVLITEKLFGWQHISYRIPLYMFIFLVALGSDYNIFITTRIRGEALAHGLHDGIIRALTRTGGVLTSAGIILAGTFLILLAEPVKDLVEISIGVAIGVLIDTFLVRTALVPGLTLWIGPAAGWPGKRWAQTGVDEPSGAPEPETEPAAGDGEPAPTEA
ncbi:MAG TPA: MMPL family transporter, partial [Thermoleophilia bacterium]|nr:MMPL family transporter [Thermoleophilia bacterium]